MSSTARFDIDALPFAQRLQAILYGPLFPHVINLGAINFNNYTGDYVATFSHASPIEDFEEMTAEELQQLALRLQAQPHVTHLNLLGQRLGPEGVLVLGGPISMQTALQTLELGRT
jgi:hypothetical protein